MFAPALARGTTSAFSNAYRQVGIETGASTASAHQLIQMLFDGFRDAVAEARGALLAGRIETKQRAIVRAVRIVNEGLTQGLNLEGGGNLANDLQALYSYVAIRLTHANVHNDMAALEECDRLMEPLRSAWLAIGPQAAAAH